MGLKKGVHLLTDVQYVKGHGKNSEDALYIIIRDTKTQKKSLMTLKNPTMDIYIEKPEYRITHDYNRGYASLEEVNKKCVPYSKMIYAIADEIGEKGRQFINNAFNTRNYRALNDIHLWPYVYGSDIDIRTHYRYKWLRDMDSKTVPKILHKACADIETDSFEVPGFPKPETCPIDLVTIIDMNNNISYTFALVGRECKERDMTNMTEREKRAELRRRELYLKRHKDEKYVIEHQDEIKQQLHDMFDETYGSDMDYKFYFYTDELKMLTHLFQLINNIKFDFVQFWNMAFDIPYIIDRLKALGANPEDIICPSEFPIKECYFKKDNHHYEVKNKTDYARITSYTVYTDQMRNYAAIRKSSKELRSNKLGDVAKEEINDDKLNYSDSGNIKTIGYENYITYFIYNIKDVLLQVGIERKTSDLDTYFSYAYQNACDYESVFKQTVKLRAAQYINYFKQGLITGNNINIHNAYSDTDLIDEGEDDDDAKFEGALVGNPLLIDEFGVELFNKKSSVIFEYSIDFDMGAFYPNSIIAMNIDASTLIFKVICNSNQFKQRGGDLEYHGITEKQMVKDNKDSFEGDIGKEIFDNLQTKNYISTAEKFMNLPGVTELYKMIVSIPGMIKEKQNAR